MNLIQIFLPLNDPRKRRFELQKYELVEQTLVGQFGGFTAYPRQPSIGLWQNHQAVPELDELLICEECLTPLTATGGGSWNNSFDKTKC
jgi:hypothetical protein